jgi:hypothetical protein
MYTSKYLYRLPVPNDIELMDYKKNNTSTDRGKLGRGNKRASRVTRGSRNPKHGKRKHCIVVHKPIANL